MLANGVDSTSVPAPFSVMTAKADTQSLPLA